MQGWAEAEDFINLFRLFMFAISEPPTCLKEQLWAMCNVIEVASKSNVGKSKLKNQIRVKCFTIGRIMTVKHPKGKKKDMYIFVIKIMNWKSFLIFITTNH